MQDERTVFADVGIRSVQNPAASPEIAGEDRMSTVIFFPRNDAEGFAGGAAGGGSRYPEPGVLRDQGRAVRFVDEDLSRPFALSAPQHILVGQDAGSLRVEIVFVRRQRDDKVGEAAALKDLVIPGIFRCVFRGQSGRRVADGLQPGLYAEQQQDQ